jgi:hypothetical protein
LKIKSQHAIPTYEKNCAICEENENFFSLLFLISYILISHFKVLLFFSCFNFFFLFFFHNQFSNSFFFLLILNKFITIFVIFCSSSNMHILCPTFGYCVKHERNPVNILCFKCKYYNILFYFFVLNNSHHNVRKNKDEGIAHNGPIMLWWRLNDNGPRFCNAFMIKLGSHWNWNVKIPSPSNSHTIFITNCILFT